MGWAGIVKARHRGGPPPLWLFTDRDRLNDPIDAVRRLPAGLAGVVLRHATPDRALARRLFRVCRARRIAISIADPSPVLPPRLAGLHLRAGAGARRRAAFLTSSAHSQPELRRALAAGACIVFLSPVFPTASHPGRTALGVRRFAIMAGRSRGKAAALGGITARTAPSLPPWCRAAGGIGWGLDGRATAN